jgi:hypothetical protein
MFQFILDQPVETGANGGFQAGGSVIALGLFFFVLLTVSGLVIAKVIKQIKKPELYGLNEEKIREMWDEISAQADLSVMGAKLAVIEADKLLDNVLRSMVIPGETMGERLKAAGYKYPKLRDVWPAHKLRNQLVHDSAFQLTQGHAKRALKDFEKALRVLNVL